MLLYLLTIKIEKLENELNDTKQAKKKEEDEFYKRLSEERKKMTDFCLMQIGDMC